MPSVMGMTSNSYKNLRAKTQQTQQRPREGFRHAHTVQKACTRRAASKAGSSCSVHLLHLRGLVRGALDLLQGRQVVIVAQALVVVIDAQAELDHAVDAARELRGLVQVEARGQQRG